MPSRQKSPQVFLCLSPFALSTAMGVRFEVVSEAIQSGALGPVHVSPTGRRKIWIGDAERWFRSWPQQTVKQKRRTSHAGI